MRKTALPVLMILVFSGIASAQVTQYKVCDSEKVKSVMGETGSCQSLVSPQEVKDLNGMCMGQLMNRPCLVKYVVLKGSGIGVVNFKCGIIDQDFDASSSSFCYAAIVKGENGKKSFISDGTIYTTIDSGLVVISLTEADGLTKVTDLGIDFGRGPTPLADMVCF